MRMGGRFREAPSLGPDHPMPTHSNLVMEENITANHWEVGVEVEKEGGMGRKK